MKNILVLLIAGLLLMGGSVFANDVSIDGQGNVITGVANPSANLEVTGASGEDAILGSASGTGGAGVYGENTMSGDYGILGYTDGVDYYGVYGHSPSGYAGYFLGNARITGNLTVDGTLNATISETDPQVGILINGNWCASDGSQVNCNRSAPVTSETDPIFGASPSSGISASDITNWNTAFSWGDHGTAGYDTTNDAWTGMGNVYTLSGDVGIGTTIPAGSLEVARDQVTPVIMLTGYKSGSGSPVLFMGRRARGTMGSAGPVLTDDVLASFAGTGYGTSDFAQSRGRMDVIAAEDWTDDAQGTNIVFRTTDMNTNNLSEKMRITDDGRVGIGDDDPYYKLEVREARSNYVAGFINDNNSYHASAYGILSVGDARDAEYADGVGGAFTGYGGSTGGDSSGIRVGTYSYGSSEAYGVYSDATLGSTSGREYAFYGIGDGYFSGNVGIGTDPSSAKLEVRGDVPGSSLAFFLNRIYPVPQNPDPTAVGINAVGNAFETDDGSAFGGIFQAWGGKSYGSATGIEVYVSANGYSPAYGVYSSATGGGTTGREYAFYGTGDSYFSGDVGIGIDEPLYKLHVDGNIFVNGTEGFNASGEDAILYFGHPGHNIRGEFGTGVVISAYSAADALTVKENSGNVGIGTTNPTQKLYVVGDIYATGSITPGSSRELKENIRELPTDEALETLKNLYPQKFYYKADREDEHVGFIAEDVPELVATKDRKGVSSMDVVAVLTKVVQEQQKTIAKLTEEMKEIKRDIGLRASMVMADIK